MTELKKDSSNEKGIIEKLAEARGISTQELIDEVDTEAASEEGKTLEEYRQAREKWLNSIDEKISKLDNLEKEMPNLNE